MRHNNYLILISGPFGSPSSVSLASPAEISKALVHPTKCSTKFLNGSKPKFQPNLSPIQLQHTTDRPRALVSITRRLALSSSLDSLVFSSSPALLRRPEPAKAVKYGFVKPGQTVEDAQGAVGGHARSLLVVKPLLESGSWVEAQREMRESSGEQDVYRIIQSRPAGERPRLRKLYADLFNGVLRLDYAARDWDGPQVRQCYEKISAAFEEISSLI